MTSGGLSMTEGWNLQLQGRVRELEADLAQAEQLLRDVTRDMPNSVELRLTVLFLHGMDEKRARRAAIAKDVEDFLASEGLDAGPPSEASTTPSPPSKGGSA